MAIPEKTNSALRSIFRAYDIRGVVDEQLTEDLCFRIGVVFARQCSLKKVVVGYDGRLSSPRLSEALIKGLRCGGASVFSVGLVPTPILYFAINYLGAANGIMVTGSHNPVQYNGLKLVKDYRAFFQDHIAKLYQAVVALPAHLPQIEVLPPLYHASVIPPYQERVCASVGTLDQIPIVIDCAHGATAPVAASLFTALGCKVHALYDTVDGTFPAHHPDPSKPENLSDLIDAVLQQGALLGLAFDGDGDRLGVVDQNGRIIAVDDIMVLYAEEILTKMSGATIVYDVKCGPVLKEAIQSFGGVPTMCRTGHSYIKTKIIETHALFGGEMSGHIFFNDDWYGFDDGLYSAARLLRVLNPPQARNKLCQIKDRNCTHELQIQFSEGGEKLFMEQFMNCKNRFPDATISDMDGLRVEYPYGWGLVRASNTMPSIVMRFEGTDKESLIKIQAQFKEILLSIDSTLTIPF